MSDESNNQVLGIDFGTTNSSAAVFDGEKLEIIDVDLENANPKTLKSSIFIDRNNKVTVGQKAINEYLEKFEGREIRSDRRLTDDWLDVIQSIEGDVSRERIVEEVELNLPGRFIISPKRVMPQPFFTHTEAFGKIYTAEDLAEIVLREIKIKAEKQLGYEIRNVNIGRPVHFSDIGDDDLAIKRITEAAIRIGFENIQFTYEPIGAAYNFAHQNNEKKLGIVFDFGGGTFDTSIVEFYPDHSIKVMSNDGVYVGGNKFNENMILRKFMHYFGRDIIWGPNNLQLPSWIMESASRWEMGNILRKKDNIDMLENIRRQANKPHLVENLIVLIKYNLGLSLFLMAEQAKINLSNLSDNDFYKLLWEKYGIKIDEEIDRKEFRDIMWPDVGRIAQAMRNVIEKADITYEDIDVVIKTGGSSRTFFIDEFLRNLFPNAEIYENDAYTDVTAGLAIGGKELFN